MHKLKRAREDVEILQGTDQHISRGTVHRHFLTAAGQFSARLPWGEQHGVLRLLIDPLVMHSRRSSANTNSILASAAASSLTGAKLSRTLALSALCPLFPPDPSKAAAATSKPDPLSAALAGRTLRSTFNSSLRYVKSASIISPSLRCALHCCLLLSPLGTIHVRTAHVGLQINCLEMIRQRL